MSRAKGGRTRHAAPKKPASRPRRRSNGEDHGEERGSARAFWKGSLGFGLVSIPVALRPATRRDELGFSLLDRRDFSPVGYRHYNKSTGEEVEWSQIVRGYEYEPDEYVVLSDEELKQANVKATQTIEILEFVERDDIPPMFFDTPYFIEPQKPGMKGYALLRAALERSGRVGIARVVLRTRQHLAAVLVRDSVLMLDLLRYADELRQPSGLAVPAKGDTAGIRPSEIEMAERLIDGMTATWDPSQYRDDYREDVLALVERKVKSGKTHVIVEPRTEKAPAAARGVMDLMPLLKRSLEQTGRSARRGPASKPSRTGERTRRRSA